MTQRLINANRERQGSTQINPLMEGGERDAVRDRQPAEGRVMESWR